MNFIWHCWQCDTGRGKITYVMKCRRGNRRYDATSCYFQNQKWNTVSEWLPNTNQQRAPITRLELRIILLGKWSPLRLSLLKQRFVESYTIRRTEILALIDIWFSVGLTNTSSVTILRSQRNYYYYYYCLLIDLIIYLLICLLAYLLIYLLISLLIYLFTYLFPFLLACLLIYLITYLFTYYYLLTYFVRTCLLT